MSIQEELAALIAAEEECLGVGSKEFMERHKDIMDSIEQLMEQEGEINGRMSKDADH